MIEILEGEEWEKVKYSWKLGGPKERKSCSRNVYSNMWNERKIGSKLEHSWSGKSSILVRMKDFAVHIMLDSVFSLNSFVQFQKLDLEPSTFLWVSCDLVEIGTYFGQFFWNTKISLAKLIDYAMKFLLFESPESYRIFSMSRDQHLSLHLLAIISKKSIFSSVCTLSLDISG